MTTTLTKEDICKRLTELLLARSDGQVIAVTRDLSKVILKDITEIIIDGLERQGRVSIREIGVFEKVDKAEKLARDIGRNKPIKVPAFTSVKFKPSTAIKRRLTRR